MLRHMKYRGVPPSADPYSERNLAQALEHVNQAATDAKKKFDWLNVHRWLLTGQLMQNVGVCALSYRSFCSVVSVWKLFDEIDTFQVKVRSYMVQCPSLRIVQST